jgi:hypothetical protein
LYDHLNNDIETALEWNRGPRDYAWRMRPDSKWEISSENQPAGMAYGVWRHSTSPASSSPVFMKSAWVGPEGQHFTTERDIMKIDAVSAYLPFVQPEFIPNMLLPFEEETNRNFIWVDLENYINRFVAHSVMNGITEAEWNTHLATLRQLRADEYTAITQRFYRPVR